MPRIWIVLGCLMWASVVVAQDNPLVASKPELVMKQDAYGQPVLFAQGTIHNTSTDKAFGSIELDATAYDADGTPVGEGLGYLSNACGAALLPDFVLAPGSDQFYVIPLDIFEDDVSVERVDITINSAPTDLPEISDIALGRGVKQVTNHEVVQVEWIDGEHLRYGEGCRRDLFTDWTWHNYDVRTGVSESAVHPKAELIREALLLQLGLLDPVYLQHSFLSFDPNGRRLVYQTELNTVLSAEPDGSFKRRMFDQLSDRTLQGISWLEKGVFLAYYYGASGDTVTYFTADANGRGLSEAPANSTPSLITPGASPNGDRVIIGLEVDGKTGYYRKLAAYETTVLLFESPLPGNNWPGPLFEQDVDNAAFVFAAVPKDEGATLVCYNVQAETTHDIASLPIQLASDERAWWWLSPDHNTIALAADGIHGGLWLIDLNVTKACE